MTTTSELTLLDLCPAPSSLIDTEFVARRSRHRQVLRQIPDWIIGEIAQRANVRNIEDLRASADRDLMEAHLRDVADRLCGQLRLSLDTLATAAVTAAARTFYATAGDAGATLLALERQRADNDASVERCIDCAHVLEALEDVDHESLAALVTVCLWADALAGDYDDPRLN